MLSKSQDLINYKKAYKKDGIIKLDFFDKSLLSEFREYILLKFKRNFNLKDNLTENKLSECEKTNNELWSGIFKNILLTKPFYSLVMRSFELPFKEIFEINNPVICDKPNLKIHFPGDSSHDLKEHQDFHSHLGSLNSISIWIPFQATNLLLGPVQYVKGSHKKGMVYKSKNGLLEKRFPSSKFNSMELKLGECLLFSQKLIHKSGLNKSKKARISCQIRFNDFDDKNWKERSFYSIEKTYRETPNEETKRQFKIY